RPQRGRPGRRGAPEPDRPLEALVKEWVERELSRRATSRRTGTDAAGAFAFADLPGGKYYIGAEAEGWTIKTDARVVEPGADVEFTATALGRVEVTLILPDGSAPREATLSFGRSGGSSNVSWTPDDPVADLEPGTYMASAATQPGDGDDAELFRSAPQRVVVEAGGPPARLTLELKGKPGIHGAVLLPKDEKNPQVTVLALRFTGAPPDAADLAMGHPGVVYARVDDEGARARYRLDELQPGSYLVGIARGYQGPIAASQIVEVADASVTVDLALPPADRAAAIELTVLGPSGERVTEFQVQAEVEMPGGFGRNSLGCTQVGLKDGPTLVFLPAADALRRQRFRFGPSEDSEESEPQEPPKTTLVVTAEGLGERRAELAKGQRSGPVTVRFTGSATLDLTIGGYARSAVEGRLTPALVRADASPNERRQSMFQGVSRRMYVNGGMSGGDAGAIDAEGRAALGPVEAGRYEVVLSAGELGGGTMPHEIARAAVDLRPGKNSLTVNVPPLYTVEVDATSGSQLSLRPDGPGEEDPFSYMSALSAQANKAGRATFELVTAGKYRLAGATEDGTSGEMPVTVPAAGPIRFAPEPHDAMYVQVTSKTGSYAKLGLEDGDYIVGVDGT
ncbi:MAG TPA: hypothetical protein VHF22_15580, partial [Planctomycetota bacterium]|nr:hypothetical protein [Planctomycetota bacterium]